MSSCSNAQTTKVGHLGHHNACSSVRNLSECHEGPSRHDEAEDEDEDEDVDFNPFLKETLSPEASSSLSSEVEGLDGDAVDSGIVGVSSSKVASDLQKCERFGEQVVMQTTVSSEGICEKEFQKVVERSPMKRTSTLLSQPGSETIQEKDNCLRNGTDVNDVMEGELVNTTDSQKPVIDLDIEDAICTRTRARYSLASFSLDELETFLQETDDEDDLQNVDDEEEYRRFLAAVLQGGDEEHGHSTQGNEIADDDEDNDADFEIELEEALESDIDENTRDKTERKYEKGGRRPETRQNRRQKTNVRCKRKLSTQIDRPLRPLLPVLPNVPVSSFSTRDRKMADVALSCPSFPVQNGYTNGFTQQQIGQLHCLIHEHVQLLIQVFSLCVRDSSRQHIASQVKKMILEMLHKRNEVLAWKTVSYPATCFCPPYLCSSVPYDVPKLLPVQCSLESSPSNTTDEVCSQNNQTAASQNVHLSKGRFERASNGQAGTFPNLEGLFWVPYISGPIVTILDVAPLSLVEKFMNDVDAAFQDSRRRHVETSCDSHFEKEALFSLPVFPLVAQANSEVLSRTSTAAINIALSSPSQQPRKKTLAATIVESTKKQSVALVPKDIAKLSQRFLTLFNPALFPHKPPSAAVSNRVLFTDSEDELLALGMMEYNTDWKAIQQRFLPCKSKHQIFVRQKNRCSSKAPDNPIKAVRRMKTSPLTAEEVACIQEGLKVYKYDWMSVCQFIVPHRDPSLLPRQWRMAHGTQKSYKLDAEKREKRRLYELNKRKCKSAAATTWQNKEDSQFENSGGDNNNADGCIDNAGKTYVHEAFLADWTPGDSGGYPCSDIARNPQSVTLSQEAAREQLPNYSHGKAPQPQAGTIHEFPSMYNHPPLHFAGVKHSGASTTEANSSVFNMMLNTSKSQFYCRPYRARRSNGTHLVKLAPDLPPVNLPSSVRVVSQSSFRGSLHGAPASLSAAGGGTFAAEKDNLMSQIPHAGRLGIPNLTKTRENMSNGPSDCHTSLHTEESRIVEDKCVEDERSNDSDLQMHPLLFQATDGGRLPYYPLNCSTSNSSSFSFFPGNQPQLNLSLLHNPYQENHVGCFSRLGKFKESPSLSHSIDFHPLLQRTDYLHSDSISSGGKYMQLQYPLDGVETEPLVNTDPLATHRLIEKANELDLEIHLSSTCRKEGSWGGGTMTHNSVKSTTNAPDSGFTVRTQNSIRSSCQHTENSSSRSSKSSLAGHSSVVPGNNIDGYVDDMGDQSHPEIVMEQEELSDSDEENEENVEFECEEMTDSEGDEGSGCEEITEMQNEEGPSLAMEKLTSADCDHNNCEPRTKFHSQGNLRSPGKNFPSLDLGLTSQGNGDTSRSSWLSLDSGTPHSLADVKKGHESTEIRENIATKSLSSSRPGRSCKKRNPKEDMEHKQTIDGKQQAVSLASLRIPILRKSRKRARGTDPSLNIELNVQKTNCDGEDKVS
ncbi:ATPase, F1 complex, gamma subunit [Parasponia andersonii]|uniref:ATPase, F1 complex, gamma subunit n=1 Tax=Parasponia andersonii TaxID=3476 RepID=A0A2P5B545_PARAD|nr:ATPase, F1 complex, gamma subunit [Parasponia andersonii]